MSASATRALALLGLVAEAPEPVGLAELARRRGDPAGTVFRSLDALERGGFIQRYQASARYVLGPAARRLQQSLLAGFPIRAACRPYLRQLAFATGETVSLHVPLGWYVVRIAAVPGSNEVTAAPTLGESRPWGAAAPGRVFLALAREAVAKRYCAWARGRGYGEPAAAELRAIRERGFAVEESAFAPGRAALALALGGGERVLGALAIEGPVLDLARPTLNDDLEHWRTIVASLEGLARAQPQAFVTPFEHLDPAEIALAAC